MRSHEITRDHMRSLKLTRAHTEPSREQELVEEEYALKESADAEPAAAAAAGAAAAPAAPSADAEAVEAEHALRLSREQVPYIYEVSIISAERLSRERMPGHRGGGARDHTRSHEIARAQVHDIAEALETMSAASSVSRERQEREGRLSDSPLLCCS